MAASHRFAICNELFEKFPFAEAATRVWELGYQGLEIAPFTLGASPDALTADERARIRRTLQAESLQFVGLHWLLAGPAGLHATTGDELVRRRTWNYVHHMIDLCADLAGSTEGGGSFLVFGSPKQRSTVGDMTPREAVDIFTHELAHAAPHAESRGVTILVEALPANQSDVVNSLAEAVSIVKQIGSPAIQTMFDTHNAVDEQEAHAELVRRYFPYIRHVHVNEMDGREPGAGDYDFGGLLSTLEELNYSGWVSLEAFDFMRDPVQVAKNSIDYLKAVRTPSVISETV